MVTIGELNRRIAVLENIEERDSFGGVVGEWIAVGRVWAKIEPMSGSENLANEQVKASNNVRFVMRFYPALSVKHRIEYLGKQYEIVAVKDIVTAHRYTEAMAKVLDCGA